MKKTGKIAVLLLLVTLIFGFLTTEVKAAAASYTDPKTFYDTCDWGSKAEFTGSHIYYATKGRTAASINYLRFRTIGFRITATGNGTSMYIDVKRNGYYLRDVAGDVSYPDGFTYNLYCISYDTIASLMAAKDPWGWSLVSGGNSVILQMDAIMTTVQGGSYVPDTDIIAEYGNGSVAFSGNAYCVQTGSAGLAYMESIFGAGTFRSYKDIQQRLSNPTLTVNFFSGASDAYSVSGYRVSDSQQIYSGNGLPLTRQGKRFGFITIPHPVNDLGLRKIGYKVNSGSEWITNFGGVASATTYFTTSFNPYVAYGNATSTVTVNWKPITYSIRYAGGTKGQGQQYFNEYMAPTGVYK